MKRIYTLFVFVIFLFACKKESQITTDEYLETVKASLRDSISTLDYLSLDFQNSVLSAVDSAGLYLLRIPFKGKHIGGNFVLLQTNRAGQIQQGRIIDLKGRIYKNASGKQQFDGHIGIMSLRRWLMVESLIENGFIKAFHDNNSVLPSVQPVQPGNVLPEVIITYVIPNNGGGISWATWVWLQSLFNGSGVQPYYSFFNSSSNPWEDGGGGGGGSFYEPPILLDFETQDLKDGIDLQKFINCFNAIPDAGASCSIQILTDIPVDSNPNAFYDFSTGSPGHVFINIRKATATQSASQNIGFYPQSGYKASTYAPTASKLVDNSLHEFNAALQMNITPAQLSSLLIRMQQLANLNYDVDQYNCTDWAMEIFNHVRTNKLQIPLYGIPGSPMTQATSTPQGLYHKLRQMSDANDPEKPNITIDILKGYAGHSTGPCN